jgi:ATP-dependent exoDNAse (exonuclease V) beta subunit
MIWLPMQLDMDFPQYDFVFVDEAQDLNYAQICFIKKLGGRKVIVGDRKQAIYGFRGADSTAMDLFKGAQLPLSICYRCPKSVVIEAQKIVPQIEYSDLQIVGSISDVSDPEYCSGDFVLCRTNAPLVGACLDVIRSGKKAVIKGRDIGDNLVKLVKDLANPIDNIDTLKERLYDWLTKRCSETKYEAKKIMYNDKSDTILALCEGCKCVSEVISKIETIFSDTLTGVVFSTIHKAKGLEADNIYILRPDLLPHPRGGNQEMNLKYVAITRAKKNLFFIKD